jgi:hypothetical protein
VGTTLSEPFEWASEEQGLWPTDGAAGEPASTPEPAPEPGGALRASEESARRAVWGRIGAHESWGRTADRNARTAPARRALEAKFLAEAAGDPVRAANIRSAHYQRLAMRSVAARRAKLARGDGAA